MAITILPPVVEDVDASRADSDVDAMSVDSEENVDTATDAVSRSLKHSQISEEDDFDTGIITPGETVTDDPQWMRLVFDHLNSSS